MFKRVESIFFDLKNTVYRKIKKVKPMNISPNLRSSIYIPTNDLENKNQKVNKKRELIYFNALVSVTVFIHGFMSL